MTGDYNHQTAIMDLSQMPWYDFNDYFSTFEAIIAAARFAPSHKPGPKHCVRRKLSVFDGCCRELSKMGLSGFRQNCQM
jgi:hypothetical protein